MEDCFTVKKSDTVSGPPTRISFAQEFWGKGGEKEAYATVLKRGMEEGGRWVWQPEPKGTAVESTKVSPAPTPRRT